MKIAIITNYWKNSDGGGVKTYVVNLVDALKNKGSDVNLLFREGDDAEQFFGGMNKMLFSMNCYRYLRKIHPDVVHTQGTWYCLLPGVLFKKIHGCTLVHTFHSEPVKSLSLPSKIFVQNLLNGCNCITFVSKNLLEKEIEIDGFSFSCTEITHGGVSSQVVSDEEVERFNEQYGIDKNSNILLAQAMTAHPLKAEGLKLLIKSISLLNESHQLC